MEFEPLRCILQGTEITSNAVVAAGAMLFCQDTSYICVCLCVCVCVRETLLEGGGENPFSGKIMWFSRGGHMVIKSYAKWGVLCRWDQVCVIGTGSSVRDGCRPIWEETNGTAQWIFEWRPRPPYGWFNVNGCICGVISDFRRFVDLILAPLGCKAA